MKTSYQRITRQIITVWCLLIYAGINSAQVIVPAQIPLYVGISSAKPNIMLMVDSSGSMTDPVTSTSTISSPNLLPSNFSYNCPISNHIAVGLTPPVYVKVNSTGTIQICKNTSCSSTTTFSNKKKGQMFR